MQKPKFLLNENIGKVVANILRQEGYNTASIIEEARRAKDKEVLARAFKGKRILVTLDKDFGRLVFMNSKAHLGVLFLRLKNESPETVAALVLQVFSLFGSKLSGKFTIVSDNKIRMRTSAKSSR